MLLYNLFIQNAETTLLAKLLSNAASGVSSNQHNLAEDARFVNVVLDRRK